MKPSQEAHGARSGPDRLDRSMDLLGNAVGLIALLAAIVLGTAR